MTMRITPASHLRITLAAWLLAAVACGPSSPRSVTTVAAPPASTDEPPVAAADDPFPDEASRALALSACTGYDRCGDLAAAWRDGREPADDPDADEQVSAACMTTVARLSEDGLEALRACLDQGCHGGCDCVDWIDRWGPSALECNLGDNPSDFRDQGDEDGQDDAADEDD
ncbi:MAG: hypothetical protein IPL61_25025 [Myxococcales bacterium]|nr:hypothetical protein [Myxococcales bacterium]